MDIEPEPTPSPPPTDTSEPSPATPPDSRIRIVKAAAKRPENEPPVDPQRPAAETAAFKADAQQAVLLRYVLALGVFMLLCREIAAVLDVFDRQGRGIYHLDSWLIGLLITVVFVQTAYILRAIVVHLFPLGGNKLDDPPSVPNLDGK